MTDAAQTVRELTTFYDGYIGAVNREDWQTMLSFFAYPWTYETNGRPPKIIESASAYGELTKATTSRMKDRGWKRSTVTNTQYYPLALETALITVDVARHRADDSIVEKLKGQYTLRRDNGTWKIVAIFDKFV
jgi:hypothetical protein